MPQLSLSILYKKNTGIILSVSELKALYFTGIDFKDQFGNPIPDETINFFIEAAQKEVADQLSIKLQRMEYTEKKNFVYDDWIQWGYVPTTYPVNKPLSLQGFVQTSLQIDYPVEWMGSKTQSPDDDLYHRSISLVPITGGAVALSSQPYFLQTPYSAMYGSKLIPHYWEIKYVTGFEKIPADILNYIGRLAAINLFTNIQDIVLGVGVASKSIGIDGLSQSISTTASAMYGLFSARLNQYDKDLKRQWPLLKARYLGITLMTV